MDLTDRDFYIGENPVVHDGLNTWLNPFELFVSPSLWNIDIMPSIEHSSISMPYVDGEILTDAQYKNRTLDIIGYSVEGLSQNEKEALKEKICCLLHSTKKKRKKLYFPLNGFYLNVKYINNVDFVEGPSYIKATFSFDAEPYCYDIDEKTFTNVDETVYNEGHTKLGVVVTIASGCVNPSFNIGATKFYWSGTVPTGKTLIINNSNKTCHLVDSDGVKTQALNKLTSGYTFALIDSGKTALIKSNNTSTKSHIKVSYQQKYLWKA